jgi:2-polyprenyl-3-methyl-5-hydroxy-6-metoxy-1,4-benzoquinol methylase
MGTKNSKDISKIKAFFDRAAPNYDKTISYGILSRIKQKERDVVIKLLNPKASEKILDAGCGTGIYSDVIKNRGSTVVGIDISDKMVEKSKKKGVKSVVGDASNIRLSMKFDKILCIGVLEFSNEPNKIIENLKYHLKSNGFILFLVPRKTIFGYLYRLYHLLHGINIRLFSLEKIREDLKKVNLKIDKAVFLDSISIVIRVSRV